MIWLLPPSPFTKLDRPTTNMTTEKERHLLTGDRGGGGRGAKSVDVEKTWLSINHSMLSSKNGKRKRA
jgi:hypothetical protein